MTEQHNDHGRTIKSLIRKAEKGILMAQLQLHEYFSRGQYVGKDENEALKFFQMLESNLVGKNLRLKSLQLSEFRRFQNLEINFDEKLTVIVGDNGAGKTSIADALSKIFSWFNNNLGKENVSGNKITESDIKVGSDRYAEITGSFQFDKPNMFTTSLAVVSKGFSGSLSSDVSAIKKFGAMYRKTAANAKIMIPFWAFYSVERSCFTLKSEISEKASGEVTSNRFSALKDALDGSGRLDDFSELYIELVNLAEGEDTKEVKDVRMLIATLEKFLDEDCKAGFSPEESLFLAKLNAKKDELANMLGSVPSAKYKRHLSFVNSAIEAIVPDVRNLKVDRRSGKAQLRVENFGNEVNITQLSQGQKTLVALTGDLARRLVTLNPDSDNPLHCHGIVVIDEIELHLHPKWQQAILMGLQRTFPNLQLIVTTHSPQVLSTVRRKNIRVLGVDANGLVVVGEPLASTYGEPSGDVLQSVMLVDPLPPIAEKAELQRLTELVDQGLHDLSEAKQLMDKLTSILGQQHPQLLRLQRSIQRQKALKG